MNKVTRTPNDYFLTLKGFTSKDEINHFIVWLSDQLQAYYEDWSEGDSLINPKIRETLYISKTPPKSTNNLVIISVTSDLE